VIQYAEKLGACGVMLEKKRFGLSNYENELPADFSNAFLRINIQTTNKLYFVKGLNYDFEESIQAKDSDVYNFNSFLHNDLNQVLRLPDYFRKFDMFTKKTYLIKNY